ncbi:Xaa-Pro dipeptidyl-peptidase [Bombilactobacillus folatiphilus]|uniref:Xaa-Pro dipeptidyl-peptidase n=1 Tax=Bombilactobacillus folatiphilus TaxID=2923362 RepID=A0ABY4PB75_9LACO|nr:Xaa-Pro dipeptidyl-peptidase [Bombilactobacillus folatiphilus]UQS82527.1 Xaa-Pro dipeptidyl-peptidase [Bombilactobacillus folatiphilus]
MKLNQFGIRPTTLTEEINELQRIKFIDEESLDQAPNQLLRILLCKCFPETNTLDQQLNNLMATADQNAAQYLTGQQVSATAFYNLTFQLLGLEIEQDFNLATPLATKVQLHYPQFEHEYLNAQDLVHGWYQLLITHTIHGQTYLDELASRGYFVKIMQTETLPKPLFFNGKAQPVFDTTKLIHEVVYVESSQDTDHDQQRDLLKAEIIRPVETNQGLQVPALYTSSPYNQGTNDFAGEQLTHNVQTALHVKQPTDNTVQVASLHRLVPNPSSIQGEVHTATESFGNHFSYSLNDYFLARGFAVVYAAGIGTKDSDGLRTCGDPEETISTTAIIEWLNGSRTAFTNKTDCQQTRAWWCNHHIAMTGRSYLGTLAIAAATTGVAGLKTIIAEAAISSWYDYYREHGLVVAPGGFPGEDSDVLAEETFSRQKQAGDYLPIKNKWHQQLQTLTQQQDRLNGDYNNYWDQRNYRRQLHQIKADVILVHGLNDWNVKPKNVQKLWDGLRNLPITKKLILHQGPHIYINNNRSLDFNDMMNLWLSYKLYDLDNQAAQILPNVLIQDNTQAETWQVLNDWNNPKNPQTKFYLAGDQLLPAKTATKAPISLTDQLPTTQFQAYNHDLTSWQHDLTDLNNTNLTKQRLTFLAAKQAQPLVIDGRPQLNLRIACAQPIGMISARLVDYGDFQRLAKMPSMLDSQAYDQGYHYHKEDLKEYQLAQQTTPYQLISLSHLNLQNRTKLTQVEPIFPGKYYDLSFKLQPTHYQLAPGHQLGLIIYGTDFEMTIRPNQDLKYHLDLNHCTLNLPHL